VHIVGTMWWGGTDTKYKADNLKTRLATVTILEPKPKTAVLRNTESKPKPQFSGG